MRQKIWLATTDSPQTTPQIAASAKTCRKTAAEWLSRLKTDGKVHVVGKRSNGSPLWARVAGIQQLNPLTEAQQLAAMKQAMDFLDNHMPWTDCDRESFRTAAYFGRV